jgi:hypothetical protein
MYVKVEEIRDTGAEYGDRESEKPVRERSVSTGSELPRESDDEHPNFDGPALDVAVNP